MKAWFIESMNASYFTHLFISEWILEKNLKHFTQMPFIFTVLLMILGNNRQTRYLFLGS